MKPVDIERLKRIASDISPAHHRPIINCALSALPRKKTRPQRELAKLLHQLIQVDGFRDITRVPKDRLLSFIIDEQFPHKEAILLGSIPVWYEEQIDLRQKIEEFALKVDRVEPAKQNEDSTSIRWNALLSSKEGLIAFTDDFTNACEQFDLDDVVLMLKLLKFYTDDEQEADDPVENTDEHPVEEIVEYRWDVWLEDMESWPLDAAEWDAAEVFIERFRAIAVEKCRERAHNRDRLTAALARLNDEFEDDRLFFGFKETSSWDVTHCPLEDVSRRAEPIEQLIEAFDQRRIIKQQPTESYEAARLQREEVGRIEDSIVDAIKQIKSQWSGPIKEDQIDEAGPDKEDQIEEADENKEAPSLEHAPPLERSSVEKKENLEKTREREQTAPGLDDTDPVPPVEIENEPVTDIPPKNNEPEEASTKQEKPDSDIVAEVVIDTPTEGLHPKEDTNELKSAKESAILLQKEETDTHWEEFFWALIGEGDLPAAYWLARSFEANDGVRLAPPRLLLALQASRWLRMDNQLFVEDLMSVGRKHDPLETKSEQTLGMACALPVCILIPAAGLASWLDPDVGAGPDMRRLAQAVAQFSSTGMGVRSEDLRGITGQHQFEERINEVVENARQWFSNAPRRNRPAILKHMIGPKGDLYRLLKPIVDNQPARIDTIKTCIEEWGSQGQIIQRIHSLDQGAKSKKSRKIVGGPLNQLVGDVEKALDIARTWCDLVERKKGMADRGDWWVGQVAQLQQVATETIPSITASLKETLSAASSQMDVAIARVLHHAVEQVQQLITVTPAKNAQDGPWQRLTANASNADMALNRRLLWFPEIPLSNNGQINEEALPDIAHAVRDAYAVERALNDAYEIRQNQKDYRFIDMLRDLSVDEKDVAQLEDQYNERLEGARNALMEMAHSTENTIEQALVDGIITDEDRAEYGTIIEAMKSPEILHFQFFHQQLESIQKKLNGARIGRLEELTRIWQDLRSQLDKILERPQLDKVYPFVQNALERGDTRVVEECQARLRAVLDSGDALEEEWFTATSQRDILDEFIQKISSIEKALSDTAGLREIIGHIRQGRTAVGCVFGEIPKIRRDEATKALEVWRKLKQKGAGRTDYKQPVATVMRYLSFNLAQDLPVRKVTQGRDWVHVRVKMSASDLARPISQFGSQSNGQYDVVCIWERPAVDTLRALLRDLQLDSHNAIVIYLGRLSFRQRQDIASQAHRKEMTLAILDEILMVFLAGERYARLPAFLQCSLPFSAINPYMPFRAGDVPPEIFYGRLEMTHNLIRTGRCIVYGGRQLGKSALLRQVQREFHNPALGRYARVDDIKLVGDSRSGLKPEELWRYIREGLKEWGMLPSRVTTDKHDELARRIRALLEEDPQKRILFLFDEADNFLNADASDNFQVVDPLRILMVDTQQRFKVVFAGLHDVQRFDNIGNQPLAHFGASLRVGPLEALPAQQLVREPLQTLGFRLEDDTVALKILSYTNYHPGLIQLFCRELVRKLHARTGQARPPWKVTQSDVEAVYRSADVRDRIRERLDWTLALDLRYQAIAWAMIYQQKEIRDSYGQSFSTGELLELVQGWWARGFEGTTLEELRSLLDEMCGLGILVRNYDGHYRLRSPNLVRLMGTETDIENRLLELEDKTPPVELDIQNHRFLMDSANQRYSPLTLAQEGRLRRTRFGTVLLFGSEALGLGAIPEVLERLVQPDKDNAEVSAVARIPSDMLANKQLAGWLEEYLKAHDKAQRLIVYGCLTEVSDHTLGLIEQSLAFGQKKSRRQRQWMRIVFVFDPVATWGWLGFDTAQRSRLEEQVDSRHLLRRWNLIGIKQRLSQTNIDELPEICQDIAQSTGGWPVLIDHLFSRISTTEGLAAYAGEDLAQQTELCLELRQQVGIEVADVAKKVLAFIVQQGGGPVDLLKLELQDKPHALDAKTCDRVIEFLRRMGCIEIINEEVKAEPVIGRIITSI